MILASDDPPVLVLEWVATGRSATPDDERFGSGLAHLHSAGAPSFGREDRRTTGSRGLPNEPTDTWSAFFAERRLLPLAELCQQEGVLSSSNIAGIRVIADRLEALSGPPEPPARLHGDLWAGNRLVDRSGTSWLIDPACFGGHREFDLAMMRLFGGFADAVFAAYERVSPLADGWRDRVELWQLAPLLVHAIKFGGGYVPACERVIARYR